MVQVVPKWKVTATFGPHRAAVVVFISNPSINDVLRIVSSMQFTESGQAFETPTRICVELTP